MAWQRKEEERRGREGGREEGKERKNSEYNGKGKKMGRDRF